MASPPAAALIKGGTLDRTRPADFFRTLYVERATAQVLISRLGEERTFWFEKGQLVAAASNREAHRIGELLRLFGLATEAVLFSAFERALAEPGRGLSKALAETGAIPPYVADACVRALAERILFETIPWNQGAYTITPLEQSPDLPVRFDKSNGSLILEGLRRLPAGSTAMDVAPGSRPYFTGDLLLRYQLVSVTPSEAEILSRLDGHTTAEDLTDSYPTLARMAAIGLVQLARPGEPEKRLDGPTALASMNVEVAGAQPSPRAAEQMEKQTDLVWNTYRRIDWATHYDILGVDRDAAPDQVLAAVHERAKLFHPDNVFRSSLGDARDALESLFKKVVQADATLKVRERRDAYDSTIASEQAILLPPSGGAADLQAQIAKANFQRARQLFEEEDFYPAFEMVRQSVEFDPSKSEYWILLSKIQRKNPKWLHQSVDTMKRAVEAMPTSVELWFELAEASQLSRNEPERIKALREVLKLDPSNRRAQAALAEIASVKPR